MEMPETLPVLLRSSISLQVLLQALTSQSTVRPGSKSPPNDTRSKKLAIERVNGPNHGTCHLQNRFQGNKMNQAPKWSRISTERSSKTLWPEPPSTSYSHTTLLIFSLKALGPTNGRTNGTRPLNQLPSLKAPLESIGLQC
jgi:hypothetical protein